VCWFESSLGHNTPVFRGFLFVFNSPETLSRSAFQRLILLFLVFWLSLVFPFFVTLLLLGVTRT
jgi:hypothetical protein